MDVMERELFSKSIILWVKVSVFACCFEYLFRGNPFPEYLSYIGVVGIMAYYAGFKDAEKKFTKIKDETKKD